MSKTPDFSKMFPDLFAAKRQNQPIIEISGDNIPGGYRKPVDVSLKQRRYTTDEQVKIQAATEKRQRRADRNLNSVKK